MNTFKGIILFGFWMLAVCLGASCVFIVTVQIGHYTETQGMFWMFGTLITLISFPCYLINKK
jgi:hypothetical protein